LVSLISIIAGLVFVIVEMFYPGFGAPGITGGILLVVGVLLYARSPLQALIMVVIILAILGVALTLVLHSASKGHLAKHLILRDSLDENVKFSAADDLNYFVGSEGKALTVLRPSGTADFNGVKLDVVTEGEFIPKDSAVTIIEVEGYRIVVKQKL
jgi:membrane-bound ClpP family serine protease